ncbi:hypothetical protein B0T25DRAFT_536300, partial [Lasiosphaeria hispida]
MDPHQQPVRQPVDYNQLQDEKAAQHHYAQQQYQPQLPAGYGSGFIPKETTTLPIKRSIVLGLVSALVLLLICVIGLAAGLGVSQQNLSQTKSELQLAQEAVAAAAISATPSKTTVNMIPTTTSQSTKSPTPSAKSDVQCPAINGTLRTVSTAAGNGTAKRFRLLCGFDYGQGEATDIGNVKTKNLDACADACASKANCTGAGWGVISGDKGVEHKCWMKTNLTKPHAATSDWGFVLLLPNGAEGTDGS